MDQLSGSEEYWEPHFAEIGATLKGQPFWKTALFTLMCLQRQWLVYERLCVGREWGNAKAIAKVLERLWKAIPTGYSIGDSYRGMVDDSTVVVEEDWDALAADFIETLQSLFEVFETKDKKVAPLFASRNVDFLDVFLDFEGSGYQGIHPPMDSEREFQLKLAKTIKEVQTADKLEFIKSCHEINPISILGDLWFADYPNYQPLKKRHSKPMSDGLRFRTVYQTNLPNSKDWRGNYARLLLELEAYKASGYCARQFLEGKEGGNNQSMAEILIQRFSEQNYLSFYSRLCSGYYFISRSYYLFNKPMAQTLQTIYQGAQCAIISKKLYDRTSEKERKEKNLTKPHWGFGAEGVLQSMLAYLYEEATVFIDDNTSPYARFIHAMLLGQYTEAGKLLEKCSTEADPIYSGADFKMVQALYGQNADDIRKSVVQMIRAVRRVEDLYLEFLPILPILVMRAAAQMGLNIKKIDVSELPQELIGAISPFQPATSQAFGIEQISTFIE